MALAGVPQIIKIFKNKSAKDISAITYIIVFSGAIVWIFYSLRIKDTPLFLSNCIGMAVNATILVGWYLYGREKT